MMKRRTRIGKGKEERKRKSRDGGFSFSGGLAFCSRFSSTYGACESQGGDFPLSSHISTGGFWDWYESRCRRL